MRLKRIVAPTMQEALEKTRRELGPDAVILNARTIRSGGLFGFLRATKVEVTVALDAEPAVGGVAAVETVRVPSGRSSEPEPGLEIIYRELQRCAECRGLVEERELGPAEPCSPARSCLCSGGWSIMTSRKRQRGSSLKRLPVTSSKRTI